MRTLTSPTGKKNNPSRTGFTLIELLIVMVIISLATGLSIAFLSGGEDDGLNAANIVLASAGSARSQARLGKEPVTLSLTEGEVRLLPGDGGRELNKSLPAGVSLFSVETAREKRGEAELIFHPRGITNAAMVYLRHKDSVYSVYIPAIGTGKVFAEERTLDQILKE